MTDPSQNPKHDPLSPESGIAPEVSRRVSSILDAVEREATHLRSEAREEAASYLEYSRQRADELVAERQRRIAALSDEIIAKAETVIRQLDDAAPVRAGFESLVRALGDAAERLSQEAAASGPEFQPPPFNEPAPAPPVYTPPPYSPPPAQYAPPPSYAEPTRAPAQPVPEQVESPRPQHPQPPVPPPPAPAPDPVAAPDQGQESWQGVDDGRLVGIQMAAAGRTRGQVREYLHNQLRLGETRGILDEIFGEGSGEDARVPWTAFPR
jgi:vacuolar-type H+-ATPase subunit H